MKQSKLFLSFYKVYLLNTFILQFLKKVQRQERVVDEVKLSLKPFYNKKTISKTEYKDIMRKCVQKVIIIIIN